MGGERERERWKKGSVLDDKGKKRVTINAL